MRFHKILREKTPIDVTWKRRPLEEVGWVAMMCRFMGNDSSSTRNRAIVIVLRACVFLYYFYL